MCISYLFSIKVPTKKKCLRGKLSNLSLVFQSTNVLPLHKAMINYFIDFPRFLCLLSPTQAYCIFCIRGSKKDGPHCRHPGLSVFLALSMKNMKFAALGVRRKGGILVLHISNTFFVFETSLCLSSKLS